MDLEEDEDAYLTYTDYLQDYPLSGLDNGDAYLAKNNQSRPELSSSYQHHTLDELNQLLADKGESDFFALHINAVSLVANYDEINSLISAKTKCFPDILCISESRLKDSKIDAQTQLVNHPEYNLVFDNSPTSAGGSAVYIKKGLNYIVKNECRLEIEDCESIFLELDLHSNGSTATILIGCIYRHPRPTVNDFCEEMSYFIQGSYRF